MKTGGIIHSVGVGYMYINEGVVIREGWSVIQSPRDCNISSFTNIFVDSQLF